MPVFFLFVSVLKKFIILKKMELTGKSVVSESSIILYDGLME